MFKFPENVPERARVAGGPASAASGLSQAHAEVVARLVMLFRTRKDDLDLALMKVIAEGESPAEWIASMLVKSLPAEIEVKDPAPRRAIFLGE